ncbi:MAG: hypothetical protein K0S76_2282 [Herbinix sp.]|jgi:hypothetical protein|nr:hypothetical protein [Herbinix sp.]
MEHINKLIYNVFAGLLFCLGVAVFVHELSIYNKLIDAAKAEINRKDVLYSQANPPDQEIVTGSKLIATLLQTMDYDMMIDGTIIRRSEHTLDRMNSYSINAAYYNKGYLYDPMGNIIMVTYTGIP